MKNKPPGLPAAFVAGYATDIDALLHLVDQADENRANGTLDEWTSAISRSAQIEQRMQVDVALCEQLAAALLGNRVLNLRLVMERKASGKVTGLLMQAGAEIRSQQRVVRESASLLEKEQATSAALEDLLRGVAEMLELSYGTKKSKPACQPPRPEDILTRLDAIKKGNRQGKNPLPRHKVKPSWAWKPKPKK